MSTRPTFFIDRSLGKKVGEALRAAGASVELHDDHFDQVTKDSEWIPDVSARGWVILTKDKNIRRPRGEREDVLLASARVFTLTGGNLSSSEMAARFEKHLADMEQIALNQSPPFVYSVTESDLRPYLLEPPTQG